MINCCNGCVPPKRSATCHASCPDYAEARTKHEAERKLRRQSSLVQIGLDKHEVRLTLKLNKKKRGR